MFELMKLSFAINDLEPFISEETLEYHYNKHHKWYVDKLNLLIKWTKFEWKSLEEIIKNSDWVIFNNAWQVWNHNFYWNSLISNSSKKPGEKTLKLLTESFWSVEKFKEEFIEKAISNFGSWWTWLIQKEDNKLYILNTSNANNPLTSGENSLLVADVWEHAYYIDERNDRKKYLENFWNIINWDFVEKNIK